MNLRATTRRIAIFGLGLLLGAARAALATPDPADIVFLHGGIYTVDAARGWAAALAVRSGRIIFVGDDAGAAPYVGASTRVVDLTGRMLLPGFQDSHLHPSEAPNPQTQLSVAGLRTTAAVLKALREFAVQHPHLPWIIGKNIEPGVFRPEGAPTRRELDSAVSDRPVLIYETSLHLASANSRALAAAHLSKRTRDPQNGRIGRASTGEPNGVLYELTAIELVLSAIPPRTARQRESDLAASLQRMLEFGITAAEDARVLEDTGRAYKALDARGELRQRINLCLYYDPDDNDDRQFERLMRLRRDLAGHRLSADCVKFVLDGGYGAHGLYLLEPYSDDPGTFGRGNPTLEAERLNRVVKRLDQAGFELHIHANGDGTVREALDALAAARDGNGPKDRRPTMAHLALVSPEDVPRFRELGVVANMTPFWSKGDAWERDLAPRLFGPERAARNYPTRTLLDSGAVLVWGTDWPVTTLSPLEGLEVAVTHRYPGGRAPSGEPDPAWNPGERLSLEQALVAYTAAGAFLLHEERQRGSLVVGAAADLVVLSRNLFAIPTTEIHDARADMTVIGGEIVYEAAPGAH